jgi:hypothetical protein
MELFRQYGVSNVTYIGRCHRFDKILQWCLGQGNPRLTRTKTSFSEAQLSDKFLKHQTMINILFY